MSGRFITLEGGEGAGKSTQAKLLAHWLRDQGHDAIETREPGGTPGADAIRALLLSKDVALTPLAEAYLFAAARADHVEQCIAPAIAAGKWVICDRFVDSSLAYQGAAGGLGMAEVRTLNENAVGQCWPDLTLLLRTGVGIGAERATARDGEAADRFSARDTEFHEAVANAFDDLAAAEPDRFAVIDAGADIDTVAAAIRSAIQDRLS
ncbi:MAG: dTMP kinase [Sphingomonadaceae bacterium]|nr:dTMP kinase [Sphingomonadaceae bacterium]